MANDVIGGYAKAVAAFILPGLVVISASLLDGSQGGTQIVPAEWVEALVASLTTFVGVYAVPNARGGGEPPVVDDDYPQAP